MSANDDIEPDERDEPDGPTADEIFWLAAAVAGVIVLGAVLYVVFSAGPVW